MQEVKLVEWLNKETFEVKSLPDGTVIKGIGWVRIPEDAEFAVSDGTDLKFRKGSKYFGYSGVWVQGSWCKEDYPMGDWKIVWERKTPQVAEHQPPQGVKQQTPNKDITQFIEQRAEVFKKLLQGVKYQYRYNDVGQWHNLTEKSVWHFLKPNVVVRDKPQKITIDGIEMNKDAAIKYIQKNY